MKNSYLLLIGCILFSSISAQTPSKNRMVPLTATIDATFPSITLHWLGQDSTTSYDLYRKERNSDSWNKTLATGLASGTRSFTDTNVIVGEEYEYLIKRNFTNSPYSGYSFMLCAIERPAMYNQGILILVIDTLTTDSILFEVNRWIEDAEADGWVVKTIEVNPSDDVTDIKAAIVATYWENADETQALFLLGQIPVPYSGNICPDGHPDHSGAWPSDGYYAEIDGNWTDISINNSTSGKERTTNIPGDGKFDQSIFPSTVELQLGRVDMKKLLLYNKSEVTLLKQYLDKNHAYKNKDFTPINRGLIKDNFTSYIEGFAGSAFSSFYTLCDTQVYNIGYNAILSDSDYQWAYGCGGGTYTSCSGVITSSNLATDTLQNIFNFIFGSYFGDWDNENSLLRSALASGSLSVAWSGRPFWYVHQMAMGYPIGYCAKRTMNNSNTYYQGAAPQGVHISLLGDPTLKAHVIAPPSQVVADFKGNKCFVSWSPSTEPVLGYYVFKRIGKDKAYQLLTNKLITDTSFIDESTSDSAVYQYLVRAVKLQFTPSGSYYNLSLGKYDTAYNAIAFVSVKDLNTFNQLRVYPNPTQHQITIENGDMLMNEITVFDILGKEVKHVYISTSKSTLDISDLQKGMYLLKIKSGTSFMTKKIIKE